jgi:hypothetical protein
MKATFHLGKEFPTKQGSKASAVLCCAVPHLRDIQGELGPSRIGLVQQRDPLVADASTVRHDRASCVRAIGGGRARADGEAADSLADCRKRLVSAFPVFVPSLSWQIDRSEI